MPDMNTINSNIYTNNSQGRFVLTNYIDLYKLRARNNMPMDTFSSSATVQNSPTMTVNVPQEQPTNTETEMAVQQDSFQRAPMEPVDDPFNPSEKTIVIKEKKSNPFPWLLALGLATTSAILFFKNRKLSTKFKETVAEETNKIKQGLEDEKKALQDGFSKQIEDLKTAHTKEIEELKTNQNKNIEELKTSLKQEDSETVKYLKAELEKAHAGIDKASEDIEKAGKNLESATKNLEEAKGTGKKTATYTSDIEKSIKKRKIQTSNNVESEKIIEPPIKKKENVEPIKNDSKVQNVSISSNTEKYIKGAYKILDNPKEGTWNIISNKSIQIPDSCELNSDKLYNRIFWDLRIKNIDDYKKMDITPFITKNVNALNLDRNAQRFPSTLSNKYIYGYYDNKEGQFNILGSIQAKKDSFANLKEWNSDKEILGIKIPPSRHNKYYDGNTFIGTLKYMFPGIFGGNKSRGKVMIHSGEG